TNGKNEKVVIMYPVLLPNSLSINRTSEAIKSNTIRYTVNFFIRNSESLVFLINAFGNSNHPLCTGKIMADDLIKSGVKAHAVPDIRLFLDVLPRAAD